PDRPFEGKIEEILPQAVVTQGVTQFPVLINLDNSDGALKPGMNGEASAHVDQRDNVVAVSNDAIKTVPEGAGVAPMLGISVDSFRAQLQAQMSGGRGGGGANPAQRPLGGDTGQRGVQMQPGAGQSNAPQSGRPSGTSDPKGKGDSAAGGQTKGAG